MNTPFALWLEFEQYAEGYPGPEDDPTRDFCNAVLTSGGYKYGLNIWTFGFLEYAREHDDFGNRRAQPSTFLVPPDLLVDRLDRELITAAIASVLDTGLPESWIPVRDADDGA